MRKMRVLFEILKSFRFKGFFSSLTMSFVRAGFYLKIRVHL